VAYDSLAVEPGLAQATARLSDANFKRLELVVHALEGGKQPINVRGSL
jgi:hypothetical protein